MTAGENKDLIRRFVASYEKGDIEGRLEMMHDDVVWWTTGGDLFPYAGARNKIEYAATSRAVAAKVKNSFRLEIVGMVAEDDCVAMEAKGHGATPAALPYNNLYHFLFKIRDGKISEVKEYMDTLYAKTILFPPEG
ncbi:nuclear transport factor 2 family protein [Rhizorhabdus argentea]|uniref:nuclear transport factor 2 family protein n=1 Tax=Rhizorhabdus argentea TaxID=1387174 RepID=UPI0030EB7EAF